MKILAQRFLVGLCFLGMSTGVVQAQEEEEQRRFENVETTKVKAMSQQLASRIEPARACLAPEPEVEGGPVPEPDAQCALDILQGIQTNNLPGHEKAELWNLLGYTYYLLQDQARTKEYYTRVINEPEANAPLVMRTLKTVAQLHMMDEQWDLALRYYTEWMSFQQVVGASDYALLANIYYNMEDLDSSLENIEIAIEMRESNGEIAQENWYAIQKAISYEQRNFRKCIEILNKLIVNYPNVRYWRELGGMYAELEEEVEQMAAYHIAYIQDGFTSEGQYTGLAYMFISALAPYKAADILIDALEEEEIEDSEKNLQLIGSALYQSAELHKALPWMERAAEKSTDGESFARLSGIYVDLERYEDALRTATEAAERGAERMDLVYLTKGNAEFNLQRYDDAIRTFRQVDRDSQGYDSAVEWIRYVEAEKRRAQQLRDSGIDLEAILASN
ncbi:MAG: tetratricopeptide repeat protein [Porticoccaceae bacterium]